MEFHPAPAFAIRKTTATAGLTWCDAVAVPCVGPRDVLIAPTHMGICGTDRHIYEWDPWSQDRVRVGIAIGHEFVGRVAQVGSAVTRVRVGDRVSGEGHVGCGVCRACRTGSAHICERVDILGIDRDGSFAGHVALPEDNVWQVDPSIPDEIAAIMDPLGNAVHTVTAAGVSGRSVVITGAGVIGLMATAVARAAGAGTIIAVDVDPRRVDQAVSLGATHGLDAADPEWPARVRALTRDEGADVLLEMSGAAAAIRAGFRALRNGGTVALLGLPAQPVALDIAKDIIFKGATVLGINGRRMFQTWYDAEAYLVSGRIDISSLITHRLPVRDFEKGFGLLRRGEALKVVLTA